jgi:hypothetical protein
MGAFRLLVLLAIGTAALFVTGERKRVLGPSDPIAADGSLTAGRALTISELKPPAPLPDLDDPGIFERVFLNSSAEPSRDAILAFIELTGPALCESDRHAQMVAAIRNFYGIKKYLSAEFHFRGPRASKFIDEAWASSKYQQVEAVVQQLLERGYLRPREIWPRNHSFLLEAIAQEFVANACSRS